MSSEEQDVAQRVSAVLAELSKSVRIVVENQERLAAEQSKTGKALGEVGVMLARHGLAIAELWKRAGLPLDDDSAPPSSSTPVN